MEIFKCKECTYQSIRADNVKRHENEKHLKILKSCESCGKQFTSSALSRHKKVCTEQMPSVDLSQFGIANDQIDKVIERTVNVKLVALKDGTVMSLANDIKIGDYTFALKQLDGKTMFLKNEIY